MSETNAENEGEFAGAWKRFVSAVRRLLSGAPQERALDPFLPLRDAALQAAESSKVAGDLQTAWSKLHAGQSPKENTAPEIAHLLMMEVAAFPAAVEISEAEEKANKEPSLSKRRLLGIGKTTVDSIRDILDTTPLAKGTLQILSEVFGIFRGD